jgi:hypothetical protein
MNDSSDGTQGAGKAVFTARSGRLAALPRLLSLDQSGELTSAHVKLVATAVGRSERAVWVTSAGVVYRRPLGDLVLRLCGEFGGQGRVVGF